MRVALYLRISSDTTGEALGVARQREDCLALAEARGYEVVEVCSDNDISALTLRKRPGFERVLELMRQGQVAGVVAWNFERLLKTRRDQLRFIDLGQKSNGMLAMVRGTDIDMATSGGRLMADLLASIARNETELKSERQVRANLQRAQSGLPHAGRRAYGYETDGVTLREDEAAVLREIGDKFLSGWSYNELAVWLNENNHKTAMGNPFYSVAVRQMLGRKRYAGIREHEGVEYSASWPPIFDRETWAHIQHTMRERSDRSGNRPAPRRYLLTGLLECGNCGEPLNGSKARSRQTGELYPTYRCRGSSRTQRFNGCGKVTRGSIPLEHFLREVLIYRLDSEELGRLLAGGGVDISPLLTERETLVAKLDSLTDDLADDILDRVAYKRATDRVRGRLAGVEDEIGRLQRERFNLSLRAGETVADAWDSQSDGWRRSLMSMLIDKIVVNPTAKKPRYKVGERTFYFDPSAVEIHWIN